MTGERQDRGTPMLLRTALASCGGVGPCRQQSTRSNALRGLEMGAVRVQLCASARLVALSRLDLTARRARRRRLFLHACLPALHLCAHIMRPCACAGFVGQDAACEVIALCRLCESPAL